MLSGIRRANMSETSLRVTGMTCGSCVRHVASALRGVAGVEQVDVTLAEGQAVVRHDVQRAPVQALIDAVTEAGYQASA